MTEHQSSRTLVKSAPELWAECSDAASLARHLGAFGEIRITKLEPEIAVAWEGAAASGTVKLETAGWGTRVTLTVKEEARPAEPEPEPVAEPEPEPVAAEPEPEPVAEPEPVSVSAEPALVEEPEPEAIEPEPEQLAIQPVPRAGMFARFRLAFRRKPVPVGAPDEEETELEPVLAEELEPVAIEPEPEPEPAAAELEPEPVAEAPAEPEPEPEPVAVEPEPVAVEPEPRPTGEEALVAALDSLGMAHHRPYSRA